MIELDPPPRHHYAALSDVRLHYVQAGDGPLVILLHGFPEFWYGWRHQIPALVRAGFRVVAPDLRGYGRSDRPRGVANYTLERLAEDVAELVQHLGESRATLVGHDWGGMVAWWTAMHRRACVARLVVANCPHPDHLATMLVDPEQLRRGWYLPLAAIPMLPERLLARRGHALVRRILEQGSERPGAFTAADHERYAEAFATSGFTGPLAYYRALVRRGLSSVRALLRPIEAPTQVVWGTRDRWLSPVYAEPPAKWVWDARLDLVDDAGHFVHADRPHEFNRVLLDFLGAVSR
jgi:epoxide hydrolase 4